MIPRSPLFAHLSAEPQRYPVGTEPAPDLLIEYKAQRVKLGPDKSQPSITNLNVLWWSCLVDEDNNIYLSVAKANGVEWEEPELTTSHIEKIISVDFTFDQLGREIIIFLDRLNNAYLYWFDPVLSDFVITIIGVASSISAGFDFVDNPSNPNSDALIFYTVGSYVYMRIQRDKWEIDYDYFITKNDDGITPVNGLEILSSGINITSRYQVVYRYLDETYIPPMPTPPIVDPVIGYFAYLMTGYQSAIEIVEPDIISATKSFSIAFQLDNVEALNAKSTLFSYGNLKQMPKASLCFSGADSDNIELNFFGYSLTSKILFGLQSGHWLIEFYPLSGIGPIDSMRVSCKPKGSDTYQVYSMEGVIKPTNTAKGQVLRIGSRPSYGERVYQVPGDVGSGFVPDSEYAFGLRAVISNIEVHSAIVATPVIKIPMTKAQGEAQTLLDATDLPVALLSTNINDYRAANWVFIKS